MEVGTNYTRIQVLDENVTPKNALQIYLFFMKQCLLMKKMVLTAMLPKFLQSTLSITCLPLNGFSLYAAPSSLERVQLNMFS